MPSKIILLIIIVALCSCAPEINLQNRSVLKELRIINSIQTDYLTGKSFYNKLEDVIFIKEKDANLVHFYKGQKKINTLGGYGSGEYAFNKLSDIALAPDGNLLILDGFEKKIKKFDAAGKFITEFKLNELAKPTLFDISLDETFYIYDEGRKEMIVSNRSDKSEPFSFGKFILSEPALVLVNNGMVQVFDKGLNSTLIFNLWGDLVQEFAGLILTEKGSYFLLEKHFISDISSNNKLAFNIAEWKGFGIKYKSLIMNSNREVIVYDFIYED